MNRDSKPLLGTVIVAAAVGVGLLGAVRPLAAQSFVRGDANADSALDISDASFVLGCLFLGGECPRACPKVADVNDDGEIDIGDPLFFLNFLFLGGAAPPAPHPSCGHDPTPDALSCTSYPHCASEPGEDEESEGETSSEPGEGDGEGDTSVPDPPFEETEDSDGNVELRLTAQLPRGYEEVVVGLRSIEWIDDGGTAHLWDSLPRVALGAGKIEGLPLRVLPPGRYVSARLTFEEASLIAGEESEPIVDLTPLEIPFPREQVVVVASGEKTIVVLDLSFVASPITGMLLATEFERVVSVHPVQLAALEVLERESATPLRISFDETTRSPRFVAGEWDTDPALRTPEEKSVAFLREHGALFLMDVARDGFTPTGLRRSSTIGSTAVRLQQTYAGLSVYGADLVVHLSGDKVSYFNGRFLAGIDLKREPQMTGSTAAMLAERDLVARFRGVETELSGEPELIVFNPSIRHPSFEDANYLSYLVVVQTLNPAGRWHYFVDADTGAVIDTWDAARHFNNSRVLDAVGTNSSSDDVIWFDDCVQQTTGAPPGEVGPLQSHLRNFFLFAQNRFGINSIDDGGKQMVARANDPAATGLQACWDCRDDETVYLTNWVTADVVAHEFTHGIVEELAGGLSSSNVQSNTLNEAHADIFAELFDCRTGGCNWLVGTDYLGNTVPGGFVRDLSSPSIDHMSNYNWGTTSPYVNIGIPSKVAYLLIAGDTHYGISVSSIGLSKSEQLIFSTLVDGGLSSSATFEEYREVMLETASSLPGFTSFDRLQVSRAWLSVGLGAITQPVVGAANESSDYFGWALATGNFNGDAYEDLAVGAPYEGYGDKSDSGVVFVFYGSSIGLNASGAEIIAQSHLGGAESSNGVGDGFGYSLAAGNFNGDDYDDLAIGTPFENLSGQADAGMVKVVYGTSSGLKQGNSTWWEAFTQAFANGAVEANDRFGWSLAAGNFNADDYDDLAVGTPYEHLGSTSDVGVVYAFFGTSQGLIRNDGTMSWEGFTQTLVGAANEAGDRFGWSLAAGNVDADAYDDLAVGVPFEHIGSRSDTGVVNIVYGSSQGLVRSGPSTKWERVSQSTFNGSNDNNDLFGWSLATGKFSNGAHDDLAIGSPGENTDGRVDAGFLTIAYGSNSGVYPPNGGWHRLAQSHAGGANESYDEFGEVLAVGNLNGDSWDELIVGVPHENAFGWSNNGVVSIFYGSSNGLYPSGWEWYSQSLTGGAEDDGDRYGWSVACGDFDNNGRDDLAAGAPWEDSPDGEANVGAIYVREY